MSHLMQRNFLGLGLLGLVMVLGVSPIRSASAADDMAAMFPKDALLYVQWPGSIRLREAAKGTALDDILNEPEVKRFTGQLGPAIAALQQQLAAMSQDLVPVAELAELARTLWRYPFCLVINSASGAGVDAAIVVHPGDEAEKLLKHIETLLKKAELPIDDAKEIKVGDSTFKEVAPMGPAMPLRWGRVGADVIVSVGPTMATLLAGEKKADRLPANPRFQKARQVVEADDATVMFYVDLRGIIDTLTNLQPVFAENHVPVLSEVGGLSGLLKTADLSEIQSLCVAMKSQGKGFRTVGFLHAPGLGQDPESTFAGKPLTDEDLKLIPRDVSFASISQFKIASGYTLIKNLIEQIGGPGKDEIDAKLAELEEKAHAKLEQDLLQGFGPLWVIYDAPAFGGFWFTGLTVMNRTAPGKQPGQALEAFIAAGVDLADAGKMVQFRKETYRDNEIHYMNFVGLPIPVAPAWTQYKGYFIAALFPQMVRMAMDHMSGDNPSLADNADFIRSRKELPPGATGYYYSDTAAGMRTIYGIGLPVMQALLSMGQSMGVEMDASALPSFGAISRHLFGSVYASYVKDDGMLSVSYGALPIDCNSFMASAAATAIPMSIALPALAKARESSKHTVSMANLKQLGLGAHMYAADHDGRFPPNLQTIVDSKYITSAALVSPTERSGRECSYYYIDGQTTEAGPENVLAFEYPDNYDGENTNALFTDGHVEYRPIGALREAIEATYERLKRDVPEDVKAMFESGADGTEPAKSAAEDNEADPATIRNQITQNMVNKGSALATQIKLFRLHTGEYPFELSDLAEKPTDENLAKKWKGPYIDITSVDRLADPWGHPLKYEREGNHNPGGYDLWSVGPDGEDGTDDDIGNWMENEK